jgi:hypothetical protein
MSDWKKGDRCVTVHNLQLRVPGWHGPAIVHVKSGTEGEVHGVTPEGLMVAWELTSTEDPVAAGKMSGPIATPASWCRGVAS